MKHGWGHGLPHNRAAGSGVVFLWVGKRIYKKRAWGLEILQKCEDMNLLLNWEKCHFMVQEAAVLGHIVSNKGIEVDNAKVEVIEKLPPPTSVKV